MSKPNIEKVSTVDDRALPVFAEFDQIAERIRKRAYELFSINGDGHEIEDWLRAEREVCWPAAELVEDGDAFELKVALAGFDTDDIAVTVNPREIIVKASQEKTTRESRKSAPEEDDESTVRWSEFHSNNVYRHVDLPADVDVARVSAKFDDGMLKIKAPKAAEKTAKKVEISTAA